MCGASSQQTELESEQAAFYQTATQEAQTTFSQQQSLLQEMNSVYSPILEKGPNQRGYSDAERENLNAQVVEGTAQNYQGASKAINEKLAAEGGGNIPMTTGGQEQLQAEIAASSAATQSGEESQIQQADYAQGYNEFKDATGAIESAEGLLSPTSYTNAATNAGSAASTTANEIAQENNSWINAAIGAAGAIGTKVVGMNPKGIFS